MANIVFIDNFDSFTYNLAHYLESEGNVRLSVRRNNAIADLNLNEFDALM